MAKLELDKMLKNIYIQDRNIWDDKKF